VHIQYPSPCRVPMLRHASNVWQGHRNASTPDACNASPARKPPLAGCYAQRTGRVLKDSRQCKKTYPCNLPMQPKPAGCISASLSYLTHRSMHLQPLLLLCRGCCYGSEARHRSTTLTAANRMQLLLVLALRASGCRCCYRRHSALLRARLAPR
jgi:hypothetical protein